MKSLCTRFASGLLLALFAAAATAAEAPPLVDARWLRAEQARDDLLVVDIQDAKAYQRFHIPGAVNAPYERWRTRGTKSGKQQSAGADGSLPSMLPPVQALEAMLSELGVTGQDHVIIAATGRGAGDLAASARVFWTLKVLGHEAVSVLDGGLVAYADTGAPLARGGERRPASDYRARPRLELAPDAEAVRGALARGVAMIDARSEGEFVGLYAGDDAERPGTIPDADHLPYDWVSAGGSGRMRTPGALQELFAARGIPVEGEQVHFCHSGNRAALTWFAAYALLGNEDAVLYDGSMMEWARDEALPIVQRIQLCEAC